MSKAPVFRGTITKLERKQWVRVRVCYTCAGSGVDFPHDAFASKCQKCQGVGSYPPDEPHTIITLRIEGHEAADVFYGERDIFVVSKAFADEFSKPTLEPAPPPEDSEGLDSTEYRFKKLLEEE